MSKERDEAIIREALESDEAVRVQTDENVIIAGRMDSDVIEKLLDSSNPPEAQRFGRLLQTGAMQLLEEWMNEECRSGRSAPEDVAMSLMTIATQLAATFAVVTLRRGRERSAASILGSTVEQEFLAHVTRLGGGQGEPAENEDVLSAIREHLARCGIRVN